MRDDVVTMLTEVNCANTKSICDYVARRRPEGIHLLFRDLPDPYSRMENIREFLSDVNNWVSSSLVVRLLENAGCLLNDDDVAYRIGFESIRQRTYTPFQRFFISTFTSPSSILKRINQVNAQYNTTKVVETVYNSPRRAVVRLHWKDGRVLSRDLCRYNQGLYAAVPTIWGLPPAQVEEAYCHFAGDPYCQYNVTFPRRGISLAGLLDRLRTRKGHLLTALEQIENDKLLLKKKYDEVHRLNRQLEDKVKQLKAIGDASRALVTIPDTDELLETTMSIVVDVLHFDRAIIMLIGEDGRYLEYAYSVGVADERIETVLRRYRVPLSRDQNIMARVVKSGKPVLVRDVRHSGLNLANVILSEFSPTSFVICPLMAENRIIGVLGADRVQEAESMSEDDLEYLATFAANMATALEKSRLDAEVTGSYIAAVSALVRAIEEKDTYTRGHSERVADISTWLAEELGLPESEIAYLRIGAMLHDVGKIGISEAIVRSRKGLNGAERRIIETHPVKGVEILKPIRFLKDYLYLVRHHHERYDGKGYPDGLKGEEIALGAQIIAVADAYDAMTSSRPYRRGLPPKQAARQIMKNSGVQFSPEVADAFVTVFESHIMPRLRSRIRN